MAIISFAMLKVYQHYNGNADAFARVGKQEERKHFAEGSNNVWATIDSAMQNIHFISSGLTSEEYAHHIIEELKTIMDDEAFKEITAQLSSIRI